MAVRGIIIKRNQIAGISYPKDPSKRGSPKIVLINGEILDNWLSLDMRNFDFSGTVFSWTDDCESTFRHSTEKNCAFIQTVMINGGTEVIENMFYTDDEILEELLK